MTLRSHRFALTAALVACVLTSAAALAQEPVQPPAQTAQAPVLPPEGSPPLFRTLQLQFHPTDESLIEPQTYLYYMQSANLVSRPSAGVWQPFNEETEQVLLEDFKRLWATNFLDDLRIEVRDQPWPNGVMG